MTTCTSTGAVLFSLSAPVRVRYAQGPLFPTCFPPHEPWFFLDDSDVYWGGDCGSDHSAFLVTQHRRKALTIVSCSVWYHTAVLPANDTLHTRWSKARPRRLLNVALLIWKWLGLKHNKGDTNLQWIGFLFAKSHATWHTKRSTLNGYPLKLPVHRLI